MGRVLLSLLLLTFQLWGAVGYDTSASLGNNGGTGALTTSYTVGASGTYLHVCFQGDTTSDNVVSVTYNAVAMTQLGKRQSNRWTYSYGLLNPATGAHNVVITTSAGFIIATAASYTGVAAAGAAAAVTGQNSSTSSLSVAITTVEDNDWVIGCQGAFDGNVSTAGTGTTYRNADSTFFAASVFDSGGAVTPAGSKTLIFNKGSSVNMAGIVYSLAPPAPTGVVTTRLLMGVGK